MKADHGGANAEEIEDYTHLIEKHRVVKKIAIRLIDVGFTPAMSFMVKPPALKTIALQGVETSNKNPIKFQKSHF